MALGRNEHGLGAVLRAVISSPLARDATAVAPAQAKASGASLARLPAAKTFLGAPVGDLGAAVDRLVARMSVETRSSGSATTMSEPNAAGGDLGAAVDRLVARMSAQSRAGQLG